MSPSSTHEADLKAEKVPKAEDFQRAWSALASKNHSLLDRRGLQLNLLEKWAEVDLEGALDAAMAEAWDNDYNPGFEVQGTSGHTLIGAFSKVFADRPLEAWALITGGKYGVGTQILRRQWVNSVAAKDGPLVVSMLREMPSSLREFAVNRTMDEAKVHPERMNAILANLLTNPPGAETDRWLKLAEWAIDLPERTETVEFFHRAVDRYIGDDLPRAKGWLEEMEPGDWHRERGLAEYSQQALRRHQDPDASRWALDQITDPALKQTAEGWRADWERETGKTRFEGP